LGIRRLFVAAAIAACLSAGCGARQARDNSGLDASGILVFSGLTSGSYLHAMRPDGSGLTGVELPKTCSPERFSRDGRVLTCIDLSDYADPAEYSVARKSAAWRRIPRPSDEGLPAWEGGDEDSPLRAPVGDRVVFVRPGDDDSWFFLRGQIVVADADGSNERVVAEDGEVPTWSPDGKRLVFARCRISEKELLGEPFADRPAECSLWTVPADGTKRPELLVENTASVPVWSPDGRFVAFFRDIRPCETFCRSLIFVVPATGGDPQKVGPELMLADDDRFGWWPALDWLPASAPVIVPTKDDSRADGLELQRCVDTWNRARMYPWPTGAVNVRVVQDRCQVTLSAYGGVCTQSAELPFRFWCPSHGAGLHMLPPQGRIWNAHGSRDGTLSLFDLPTGRLSLPNAPPYAMLDGYIYPYRKDGAPLPELKLTDETGTCYPTDGFDDYPLAYPDRYPAGRCYWPGYGSDDCFKQPGPVAVGDILLCPASIWDKAYDPLRFIRLTVTKLE
jgi:hypothetical protein